MTAITVKIAPRTPTFAQKLRRLFCKLSKALDAFAMRRIHQTVADSAMRRAEQDTDWYRRLMRKDAARRRRAKSSAAGARSAQRDDHNDAVQRSSPAAATSKQRRRDPQTASRPLRGRDGRPRRGHQPAAAT